MSRPSVNQPPFGGYDYPFAAETALSEFILDAYVEVEEGDPTLPLSLRIVRNHANNEVVSIRDANSVTLVSFLLVSTSFSTWGTRRLYTHVDSDRTVVRLLIAHDILTAYVSLPAVMDELDQRTVVLCPPRVISLASDATDAGAAPVLAAGYNVRLDYTPPAARDGVRPSRVVTLHGIPGEGDGVYPGCGDAEVDILTINNQPPDKDGRFTFELDGCYVGTRALSVDYDVDPPVAEWPTENAAHQLRIVNVCRPCQACDDYANTYKGLRTVFNRVKAAADALRDVRDLYVANRARWTAAAACRQQSAARVILRPEASCRVFVGAAYCNVTGGCLRDFELRLTMSTATGGIPGDPGDPSVLEAYLITDAGEQRVEPAFFPSGAEWPVVSFFVPFVRPQELIQARFRMCLTCGDGDTVKAVVTSHGTPEGDVPAYDSPLPAGLEDIWTTAGVSDDGLLSLASAGAALSPDPQVFGCDC